MKSCLGLLFSLLILLVVIGTVAGLWYLSYSTNFSRPGASAANPPAAAAPPRALPVNPAAPATPPRATPVAPR